MDLLNRKNVSKGNVQKKNIIESFGEIESLKKKVKNILGEIDSPEMRTSLSNINRALSELQTLQHEFKVLTRAKRQKTEQLDRMLNNATDAKRESEETKNSLSKEIEKSNRVERKSVPGYIELSKIGENLRMPVKKCLVENTDIILNQETLKLECISCRDNWKKAGYKKQPKFEISINRNVKKNVERHKGGTAHQDCNRASSIYDKKSELFSKSNEKARIHAEEVTKNVMRTVYFLLKQDFSMNIFEKLVELLDSCQAKIGNQLHGKETARKIALCIDEFYQKRFVEYLLSDECDEFSQIGDEATDVGGMKVLLTKFRFFEGWELQEMVFSIFESVGTSEDMEEKFQKDFVEQFKSHTSLGEDQIKEVLRKKLTSGGSDRASKIIKVGETFEGTFRKLSPLSL